jgi:molybdopterin-guanine dinucleotide biosynthesis protein A
MYEIPAVIFAGGKSSRMGTDKALLPFSHYATLSEAQHHKLSQLFSKVYISSKADKFDFDVQVINDKHEKNSPLVGLISVFETLGADEVFVLSVDTPLVDAFIIERLFLARSQNLAENKTKSIDAFIAQSSRGVQPLCGIYKRSILALAKIHFEQDKHRLTSLLKASKTKFVLFKEDKPFTNINTPEDYELLMS